MRVLTINTAYSTGGAANVALTLHKFMQKQDGTYSIFLSGRGDKIPIHNIITCHRHQLYQYANAMAFRLIAKDGIFSRTSCVRLLKEIVPNIDLVHLHNIHGYFMHDSTLNFIRELPVVWTLHDFWIATGRCAFPLNCMEWMRDCACCPHSVTRYPRTWLVRNFRNAYVRKRNILKIFKYLTLVVPSQSFANNLYNMNIGCDDIRIIFNGVDSYIFRPARNLIEKQDIQRRLSLPNDAIPLVCFMARRIYEPRKGFAMLQSSLRNLGREVRLLIIGESSHRIDRSPFDSSIHVIHRGYIKDRSLLADYLRVCDVVVNPSEDETFGLASLEALSCGARPVVFLHPIFKEVLGRWAVYAKEMNIESLRESILHSLGNTLSSDEVQNAHEYVRSHFSLENMCNKYVELYRQVIEKGKR